MFNELLARGRSVLTTIRNAAAQPGQVYDGFTNLFLDGLGKLPAEEQQIYAARYEICVGCSIRTGNTCNTRLTRRHATEDRDVNGCGCNLAASTKSPGKSCPAGEWGAIDLNELRHAGN